MQDQFIHGPTPPETKVPYQTDPKPLAVQVSMTEKRPQGKQFDLRIDPKKLAAATKK